MFIEISNTMVDVNSILNVQEQFDVDAYTNDIHPYKLIVNCGDKELVFKYVTEDCLKCELDLILLEIERRNKRWIDANNKLENFKNLVESNRRTLSKLLATIDD